MTQRDRWRGLRWTKLAIALCLAGASCAEAQRAQRSAATATEPKASVTATVESANPVPVAVADAIDEHCGGCHDSARSRGAPDALAVFDVVEDEWPQGLSPEQWQGFGVRLEGKVDGSLASEVRRFVKRRRERAAR